MNYSIQSVGYDNIYERFKQIFLYYLFIYLFITYFVYIQQMTRALNKIIKREIRAHHSLISTMSCWNTQG